MWLSKPGFQEYEGCGIYIGKVARKVPRGSKSRTYAEKCCKKSHETVREGHMQEKWREKSHEAVWVGHSRLEKAICPIDQTMWDIGSQ